MKHIHLKECESTQKHLLEQKLDEDTLVSCDFQSSGRGRGDNSWDTFQGSLCLSFSTHSNPTLSLTSLEFGVLICQFFNARFNISLQLKWPNDIILNGKKVGGILTHAQRQKVICGIGLNLRLESNESFGPYKIPGGTIFENTEYPGKKELSYELANFISQNRINSPEILIQQWNKRCFHLHKKVCIQDEREHKGIFTGIKDDGAAILEIEGKKSYFYSGSLFLLS